METMLKRTLFLCICSLMVTPSLGGWNAVSLQEKKQRAVKKLKARKVDFDKYQKMKTDWESKRLSVAFKQKKIRKKYADQKEDARRKFRRTTEVFPVNDYRKFLSERREKRQKLEKSRQNYSKMQNELKKVFKNREYKIDGNKEYQL